MDWCEGFHLKYLLFLCSIGYAIFGNLLISAGFSVRTGLFRYSSFIIPEKFLNAPVAILTVGAILFFLALIVAYGAVKERSFVLVLYSSALTFLLVMGVIIINTALVSKSELEQEVYYSLRLTMHRFGEHSSIGGDIREAWTLLQMNMNCCGVSNYSDWSKVRIQKDAPQIPLSCCKIEVANCSTEIDFRNSSEVAEILNIEGCFLKVLDDINIQKVNLVMIPFEGFGAVSLLLAVVLAWKWRSNLLQ